MNTWLVTAITALSLGGFGCSSSFATASLNGQSANPCYGPGCGGAGNSSVGGSLNGSTSVVIKPDVDAGTSWSPLCGPPGGGCLPDPDAGTCDDVSDAGPAVDAGYGSAVDGGANRYADVKLTCRVRRVAGSYDVERACEGAGAGNSGDPCRMTDDCGSGLTCVAEDQAGLCRPYCCADPESCPSNSYCTTRATLINRDPWVLGTDVPVCSVADNCPLSDPYPCPQGQNCSCPAGKACMVVRRHGLTACTKPGVGVAGEFCPCAAGFVCSNTTFTCLKLCPLSGSNTSNGQAPTNSPCVTGTSCQASNDVPPDWGVCSDVPLLID